MCRTLILLCLLLCLPSPQVKDTGTSAACEERARQVLKSLPDGDDLRRALEQGQRGDCVHQPWVDALKRLGIKRVSFAVSYRINGEKASLKIGGIFYYRDYAHETRDVIKDGRLLREIKKVGLEGQLRAAVLKRQEGWVDYVRKEVGYRRGVARGEMEANLLDDEALPVLDYLIN
jgi:hypothetical protein